MHWECCFASLSVTLLLRCRDCFWKILIASSNSFVQLSTKHTQSGFSKVEYLSLTTSLQPKKTKFSNFAPVVRSSQVHWFFAIWRGDRKGPQGHRVNCHLSPPCLPLVYGGMCRKVHFPRAQQRSLRKALNSQPYDYVSDALPLHRVADVTCNKSSM